ncbi:MAG: carbohydrate kinase [Lachnospiraceae bacterium]|nr:carbohydrate kinase [Lachnospiraceae bacterium]
MKYLIGIDEGTTGCKVCLFDESGTILASSYREYPSYYPNPGWVEQDIHEIRTAVFDSLKETILKSGVDAGQIEAVGYSNQGITMVLLDKDKNILRDHTIGWQDARNAEVLPELFAQMTQEEYYDRTGMALGAYNTSVLNWLKKHEPEVWSRIDRICSHQDFFLHELGADGYYIDEASANLLCMLNVETGDWDPEAMKLYNVRYEQLPTIVHEAGKVVGTVPPAVAEETGLPVGCKVCVGALDTNCCTLAVGGIRSGVEVMVVGTAGTAVLICDKAYKDPTMKVTIRTNHGMPNYQLSAMTNTAASSFRWFRDNLCGMEVAMGKLMETDPYNLITAVAENSKPGANGVTAITCLQGAHVRRNNDYARGTFLGVSLGTTKADIAHAILEGICFEMYDIMLMQEEVGGSIDQIVLCGGVTKSDLWCQMFADICEKPVVLMESDELGCLGAAMYAGIGSGVYASCEDAVARGTHIKKEFKPDPATFEAYRDSFKRWTKSYDLLCNSYYGEE